MAENEAPEPRKIAETRINEAADGTGFVLSQGVDMSKRKASPSAKSWTLLYTTHDTTINGVPVVVVVSVRRKVAENEKDAAQRMAEERKRTDQLALLERFRDSLAQNGIPLAIPDHAFKAKYPALTEADAGKLGLTIQRTAKDPVK